MKCCEHTESVGHLILCTSNMLRRMADAKVNMTELRKITGSNGWIMKYLYERDGEEVYQKDIEERFSVTRSTVSRVLKGMEEKGLLRRESVSGDARLKKLVLTEEGRKINARAISEMREMDAKVEAGLTAEEIETLQRLLRKVAANLYEKPY